METICKKLSSGEIHKADGWLLGDSGYPLSPNLLTPLLSPVTPSQKIYNRAFLKTRNTIECTFDIWKSRWRSMDKSGGSLCYSPEMVCKIIVSTIVLHNFCIAHGLSTEIDIVEDDFLPEVIEEHSYNGNFLTEKIIADYFS